MNQSSFVKFESLENRQLLSWGAQATLIGLDKVVSQFPRLTGSGESIAIIDSGVDYNHPSLGGGWGKKVIAGYDFINNDTNPMSDSFAHGTGSASMAAGLPFDYNGAHNQGIAPGANIVALRENGTSGVDRALKWVIANKAKYNIVAVNMVDFGGGSLSTYRSIQASLSTLNSMNVLVSSPAGNKGAGVKANDYTSFTPVVGSSNTWGGISGFTQRGPALDFLAPGESISLPYYDVSSKKHIYVSGAWGTSWAAPQIAGAATLLRQIDPNFTNAQILSILKDSAVKQYDSVSKLTYPRLNLYGAVLLGYQRAGQTPDPTPTPPPTPVPVPPDPTGDWGQPNGTQSSTATPIKSSTTTTLQCEDFDAGAEGVAYHDSEAANIGNNSYRAGTGVDIITANDSGSTRAVGGTKAGEWLRYTINVEKTGAYNVDFRVASPGTGGAFHLEIDGKNVGSMTVPNTRSWTTYTIVTKTNVSMSAGKHTMRLVFDRNATSGFVGNFNWMRFTPIISSQISTPAPAATSTPFKSITAFAGRDTYIQAEDFDLGAEGIAYHDADSANLGGKYRATGVDIQATPDAGGGYQVGYTKAGEYLKYTINIGSSGTFNLDARVANIYSGATFHVEVDGKNVTGTLAFTNTGAWNRFATVRKSGIALTAGKHTLKLVIDSTGGRTYAGVINWMKLS